MIKLDIQPYCNECPGFEAEVDKTTIHSWNPARMCDESHTSTLVQCKYAVRCEKMYMYLKKQQGKETEA